MIAHRPLLLALCVSLTACPPAPKDGDGKKDDGADDETDGDGVCEADVKRLEAELAECTAKLDPK